MGDNVDGIEKVPGDGNCLFHAISACLDHADNGTHPSLDLNELMPKSATLRKVRTFAPGWRPCSEVEPVCLQVQIRKI